MLHNKRNCAAKNLFFLGIFLCLFFSINATAQTSNHQRPTLYWYYSEHPPHCIISGPNQDQGTIDRQTKRLIAHLPQFHHVRVLASPARSLEMIKAQPNACIAGLLKTPERAMVMEYSLPQIENLTNGLIILRARFAQFKPFLDRHGQLRFEKLLENNTYRVGIMNGRSFGVGVDSLLKKYAGQQSVLVVPASDGLASRILKLVTQDEYDAIIGYPEELQYIVRQLKLNQHDFAFIPIAELPGSQPVYVSCSKSQFGKQVIAAINFIISDATMRRELAADYRSWLDPESAARWDQLRAQSRL